MAIKVTPLKEGGYVVAQNQCWVDGVFSTETAARKAVKVDPDRLAEIWQAVIAVDQDNGMIREEDLP
jgi:sulfite reductase beta subunit-like hemoprotein